MNLALELQYMNNFVFTMLTKESILEIMKRSRNIKDQDAAREDQRVENHASKRNNAST